MKSKETNDKKQSNSNKDDSRKEGLILFGIVLVIMIIFFSIGAYLHAKVNPKAETETSNGFVFVKSGNFWNTTLASTIYGLEVSAEFRYAPSEVKNVETTGDVKSFLYNIGNKTYFTFNPEENNSKAVVLAAADLSVFFARFGNMYNPVEMEAACTKNVSDACADRPIINCDNEKSIPVIYVMESNVTKIDVTGNCLTIQGKGENLLKAYNKVLFLWYGII